MPRRMRAYVALAEEKYNLPTYPVLINILKASDAEIPTSYALNIAGLRAIPQITDLQKLKAIQQAIKTVNTVNELQQILSTDLT